MLLGEGGALAQRPHLAVGDGVPWPAAAAAAAGVVHEDARAVVPALHLLVVEHGGQRHQPEGDVETIDCRRALWKAAAPLRRWGRGDGRGDRRAAKAAAAGPAQRGGPGPRAMCQWRRRWSERMVERSCTPPGCGRCSSANTRGDSEWGGDGDRRAVKATRGGGPRAARRTLPEGDVETMTVEEHC